MVSKLKIKYSNALSFRHYFIFFIVIFISDDTFNFGTNENSFFINIKYFFYFFLTVYLLILSKFKSFVKLKKYNFIFYLIIIVVFFTMIANFEFSGGYVYQIWLFMLGLLIVDYFSNQNFIFVYLQFIYFLSFISLIIFFLASISFSLLDIFPIQYNSAGASMYNLGISIVFADGNFLRNTSIFREPGVFMIYINIAIMLELFFKPLIDKKNLLVFIVTIFTTLSTAAFFILSVIFLAYFFSKNKNDLAGNNKFFVAFFIFISLIVIGSSGDLFGLIFDKLGKDNIGEGSAFARYISIFINLNIFFDNFIYGCGIKEFPTLFSFYSLQSIGIPLDVGNNTNTITTILAVYGLFFGVLFIYMLISLAKKTSDSIFVRVLIFLVLIMFYSNEDLRYSLMSAVFLVWGLKRKQNILI